MPWSSTPAVQPNPTAEAFFKEGLADFDSKRYARAIDRFQKIREEFPFSPQVIDADLKIAEALYLNKQYVEAIAAFKEFQTLHPTHESIPFVIYHLGLAHLDQFTATDRDQKVTEIAKGYFETVIRNYPSSAHARPAREKLAECLEHLAEHEFGIASFYLREEKYPAARDRFEGIVRNYRGTSTAVKALYQLGESYRLEKNPVKAALAYGALIQHYPDDALAKTAQVRLGEVTHEKVDPLAVLLMRDGRPSLAQLPAAREAKPQTRNLDDLNLVAKKEVVHEQPGDEREMLLRVVDTLNPFAPSRGKKPEENSNNGDAQASKDGSPGFFGSLWGGLNPFSSKEKNPKIETAQDPQLVNRIDQSLEQKGIAALSPETQYLELRPPASDLPKIEEPTPPPAATAKLLDQIDASLEKGGKEVASLPPTPEIHPALKVSNTKGTKPASQDKASASPSASGLISGIDEELKRKGIEAPKSTPLPSASRTGEQGEVRRAETRDAKSKVELDTKLTVEKGPLFLEAGEFQPKEKGPEGADEKVHQAPLTPTEIPQAVVKGPPQPVKEKAPEPELAEKKKPQEEEDDSVKGAFDRIREDVKAISNLLNPFSW